MRGHVTARQAQRVIADIYRDVSGQNLELPTVRQYFEKWVANKKSETAGSTYHFYSAKAKRFLDWLRERADAQVSLITRDDIIAFRDDELGRVSRRSVNHAIKFLRMVFKSAKEDGKYHDENPAAGVKTLKGGDAEIKRRPFTIPEIQRILNVADTEWRSLIIFGLYTGQRLGDLARLTWHNIDLQHDLVTLVTSKTRRTIIIPIVSPLRANIERLTAGDDPQQPLHPRAFASVLKSGGVKTLSRQFYELLSQCGLKPPKAHRQTDEAPGRDGPRRLSEISFHSLRHTATSLMKNAGVSASVVMDIIGHDSEAISTHYTHIDEATKRAALSKLPKL